MTSTLAAERLVVRGRVQGVGYRYWAVAEARTYRLTGWVRNRLDGTVEVLAVGAPQDLEQFVERCRIGPPSARVAAVERASVDAGTLGADDRAGFRQLPTV